MRITRAAFLGNRPLPAGLVLDLEAARAQTLIALGAAIAAEAKANIEPPAQQVKPKRDKRP